MKTGTTVLKITLNRETTRIYVKPEKKALPLSNLRIRLENFALGCSDQIIIPINSILFVIKDVVSI